MYGYSGFGLLDDCLPFIKGIMAFSSKEETEENKKAKEAFVDMLYASAKRNAIRENWYIKKKRLASIRAAKRRHRENLRRK